MKERIKKSGYMETLLYLVFGVLTTAVDWAVYMMLAYAGTDKFIANICGWTVAVIFAFITNKMIVFRSMNMDIKTVLREGFHFVLARLYTGFFNWAGFYVLYNMLHFNDIIVKALLSVFVVVSNYVISKLFIFKK